MTEAEDSTDRAAEPVACPKCGKVDLVQKISAIPDWPAEFGPPDRPGWFDLLGVASVVGGLLLAVALAYVLLSVGADLDAECIPLMLPPILFGLGRLAYRKRQRSKWEEGMSRWKRLYFCPRDEVVFIPGGASVIPLHEVRDVVWASDWKWADFAPRPERFADFSPMPEQFADFERMLEEAREKSGTLICFECGQYNPVGQTQCEECGALVFQKAKARWVYFKGK